MIVTKAHLLFEQSGTFKKAFKKHGIPAFDYDILNDFGETDYQIDLFQEINNAYRGGCSVFDSISETELAFAFFPCTRFEDQIAMGFRGDLYQQSRWDDEKKIGYTMKLAEERQELFALILKMSAVALRKGIRLIIENPYSSQSYLTQYYPIKPKVIDRNRTERGDCFRKPTQYFFINCEPENNIVFREKFDGDVQSIEFVKGKDRKTKRSMITPMYAENFIKEFILDGD